MLQTTVVTVANRRWRVPVERRHWASVAEPFMEDVLQQLLPRRAGSFVDVGVNLGQTMMIVKSIEPNREYIGFEPNSTCVAYTERVIALNDVDNASLLPVGLGNVATILALDLYSPSTSDSMASLVPEFRAEQPVYARKFVPVFPFEDAARPLNLNTIGIVKIDVEGSEWEALQGLEARIEQDRPWCLIEILPPYSADNAARVERQAAIWQMMSALDYAVWRVHKTAHNRFDGLQRLSEFGIHDRIEWSDYLMAPRSDADDIEELFRSASSERAVISAT